MTALAIAPNDNPSVPALDVAVHVATDTKWRGYRIEL